MFKLHIQIAKNKDSKNTRITVTLTDITKKKKNHNIFFLHDIQLHK